jgi:hypothetical protein
MGLWNRIKWWFRRAKYVWQRAHWGFSEYDVWDFDSYLAHIIGSSLKYLAHHNMSHPYYFSEEDWKAKLLYIAECFRQYNIEPPHPAYEAYQEATERIKNEDGGITVTAPEELLQAWRDEDMRNHKNKMKKLKEGFDLLYQIYPELWD